MEQVLTRAWQRKASWLWLLLPLTWLYRLVSWLRKTLYQWGLLSVYYSPVPVLVIGNITAGGSGKTPFIIALVEYLQSKSIKVGVISRGYGGDENIMPALVHPASTPAQVGDEPCLIVQTTGVAMAVCPNRGKAIELLRTAFPDLQVILADDGLQHYALDRDYDWIVVDSDRGFGNAQRLPTGFLREPMTRLMALNTTVVFHQQDWQQPLDFLPQNVQHSLSKNGDLANFMRLSEQPLQPLFTTADKNSLSIQLNGQLSNQLNSRLNSWLGGQPGLSLEPQTVIAMTGIGYPKRFFASLQHLGFTVIEQPFDDHHDFQLADFAKLPAALPIVVTGKDAVKIRLLLEQPAASELSALKQRMWVLPVVAELSAHVYAKLDQQLDKLSIRPSSS